MITEIFINGDSYSAENQDTIVYSKFLEQKVDAPVINFAQVGSSNDRIFRTTLEYCLGLAPVQKPLVIVGFSFIIREESWTKDFAKYANRVKDYPKSKFVTTNWLDHKDLDEATMLTIANQNINKQTVHFYTKLYMFSQTLKSLEIPYLIFSAARNHDVKELDWDSLTSLNVYQQVQADPNIINIHDFNIPTWAQDNNLTTTKTGHLYTDGHEKFADFLYTKTVSNYLTQK